MKRPQRIYCWSVAAWIVGMGVHLIWYLSQMGAQPPTDEVYTQAISFQLAAFALTQTPYWLAGLVLSLLVEFLIFGRIAKTEA